MLFITKTSNIKKKKKSIPYKTSVHFNDNLYILNGTFMLLVVELADD